MLCPQISDSDGNEKSLSITMFSSHVFLSSSYSWSWHIHERPDLCVLICEDFLFLVCNFQFIAHLFIYVSQPTFFISLVINDFM